MTEVELGKLVRMKQKELLKGVSARMIESCNKNSTKNKGKDGMRQE